MEENYKKKLRRFQRRLNGEAWLRAATAGGVSGGICMLFMLLYGRIALHRQLLAESGMVALVVFFVTAVAAFFMVMPKKKEVLARIDELGLKERMITMEELREEHTVIAQKQRQDALEHLELLNAKQMKPRLYIKPWICILSLAIIIIVLVILPVPEQEGKEQTAQNELELELMDELVTALSALVEAANLTEIHKEGLQEIVDALAVSLTPEDSTLTRTAKITMTSKRLDMYESAEQDKLTMLKQQADNSETAKAEIKSARTEQIRLSQVVQNMKNIMGVSIDILNQVEGVLWTPGAPIPSTPVDEEELYEEEYPEEEPLEGEEPPEDEGSPEGAEQGEEGEPQEEMQGDLDVSGTELIYDPEQGEVGYGTVYEEYYQAILKTLTEQEFSEEVREMIEDYATTLE